MRKPRPEPEGGGFVRAGAAEHSVVEELNGGGPSRARARVETLPAFLGAGNPIVVPRSHDAETPPGDLRDTANVRAAVEALYEAVNTVDAGCRKDAAAAAWHAEPVLRFLCPAFGCSIAGLRVNGDGFIVVTAEIYCRRRGRGEHRRGTGGYLRAHGQCRRRASRVHDTGRAVLRAVLQEHLAEVGVPGSGR